MRPHRNPTSKYRVARAAERQWNGTQFRSLAEKRYAMRLEALKGAERAADRVVSWEYEPWRAPLVCGAGDIVVAHYVPDFRVEYADGRTEWIDVKGMDLPLGKLKRAMFAACYPALRLRLIDSNTLHERAAPRPRFKSRPSDPRTSERFAPAPRPTG